MKKVIYVLVVLILLMLTIGCSNSVRGNSKVTKAPTNNNLEIYGEWKIKSINIFDDEINIFSNIENIKDKKIKFSNNRIDIIDNIYMNPSYKLKAVNEDYILSYESNLTIKEFMEGKEIIDVISIISNNSIVGEFILQEKDKGNIIYMGSIIEVYKVSDNVTINEGNNIINDELVNIDDINYYNSEVGLMIGLKTPRVSNGDGTFSNEEYRTLWISFKGDNLMPIIEKDNIIFPRMNGIWSLNKKIIENDSYHQEYIELISLDNKDMSSYVINSDENIYRNITFIGNNYIGIEQYTGNNFENNFIDYKVVPIDNVNSTSGLKIDEIYSKDINNKYKMEYENALENVEFNKPTSIPDIDYSNFTVKRNDGKWELVGNLGLINSDEKGEEYLLNIRPNSKMLNYDRLTIPWKVLKSDIPFIKDAYISPNERIAIILFEDNLAIYEIKDKMLKGAPLVNIDIGNEEVIMAEWSTGAYVEKWSKAFNNGIYITN